MDEAEAPPGAASEPVVLRLRSGQSEWADKFLQALGGLLVLSNDLEDALADLYSLVATKSSTEIDNEIRGLTLGPLIAKVTEEYEKRFPQGEPHQRLQTLKPLLREALDRRNAFVHARWVHIPAMQQVERERLPRGEKGVRELRLLTLADVEGAIDIVSRASEQVTSQLYAPILQERFRRYLERTRR